MKHSTFRKSTLISSIALLLVAIVALSGATFAWFSAKESATATGISIESGKASGLLVSLDQLSWSDSIVLDNASAVLTPASTNFATATSPTWFTATADSPNSYAASTYTSENVAEGTHYKHYTFYAKTADETTATLKISANTLTDEGNYGRIAIVSGGTVKMYYMAADQKEVFPITPDGTVDTKYPVTPVNSIANIDLGTISTSTQFDIYVWNEGQDADCHSNNGEKAVTADFNLSIAS